MSANSLPAPSRFRVLVLGGSTEAFDLAERLAGDADIEAITAMAGVTRERRTVPGHVRIGGFGGPDGLAAFLDREGIGAVVDSTHPFARVMTANAARAAAAAGLPIVHVLRPAWTAGRGDDWREVDDMAAAAAAIPAGPCFLTVGRTELAPFAVRRDLAFVARVIDRPEPEPDFARIEYIEARGPFVLADEVALLQRHGIRSIVSKNSGGAAAAPKLAAACQLGLPVIMVRRPAPPAGAVVPDAAAALAWIRSLHHA